MIPEVVSIDVSGLGVGDSIHVYDIDLGEGVEILVDSDRTICNVAIPRVVAAEEDREEGEEEMAEAEEAVGESSSGGDED